MLRAVEAIKVELRERVAFFHQQQKLVEAQRIEQRTRFDLELLDQIGFCRASRTTPDTSPGVAPGIRHQR